MSDAVLAGGPKALSRKADTHPRNNLSLPFFPPFRHLRVDLVSKLRLDLTGIPSEEREETLCPTIDDVDLV